MIDAICETCQYFDIVGDCGENEWTICNKDPCEENWQEVKETDSCEDWEISEYWKEKEREQMENRINVEELMKDAQTPVQSRDFIKVQGHDKLAAHKRLIANEEMFGGWFDAINATNTRELPDDLINLYEQAAKLIIKASAYERAILTGDM